MKETKNFFCFLWIVRADGGQNICGQCFVVMGGYVITGLLNVVAFFNDNMIAGVHLAFVNFLKNMLLLERIFDKVCR